MVKRFCRLFLAVIVTVVSMNLPIYAEESLDFDLIKSRYYDYYSKIVVESVAMGYVKSMLSDGSWSDINYDNENNKTETAWNHLERLRTIVMCANMTGSTLNNNKSLAISKVEKGLEA